MRLRPGYKQTDLGVIPVDWEVKPIKDIATVRGGKRLPRGRSLTDSRTSHPYLRVTDMRPGGVNLNDIKYVPDDIFPEIKNYRISHDDIFISVAGTLGIVGKIPPELDGANLTENADKITNIKCDRDFLLYHLMSERVQSAIDAVRTVGAQPKLALGQIENFLIPQPNSVNEQRAIAEALGDVDGLLGALDAVIAKKRDLKQAAMQQLLTGQTRLSRFSGDWDVKRLRDVTALIPSGVYGVEKNSGSLSAFQVATTAHIEMDDTWNDKEMNARYFTREQIDRYSPMEGDIIVVKSSGSAESIQSGKIGFVDQTNVGRFLFSNFLMRLRPRGILPRFLYFYLCSRDVKKLLPTLVEASTYPNIRIPEYLALDVPVPPRSEQSAIVTVLSDIDTELTTLKARRGKASALKQGMMQELLTGRTRLV
jgi:type I restriction enzyme S subunit